MIFIASLIGIVFVFGIILIIGWLTAWNLMGEFKDKSSTIVQTFCNAANVLTILFISIQNFAREPENRPRRKKLLESIDEAGKLIDTLILEPEADITFGSKFSELFRRKVKIYSRRKTSIRKKLKLLRHNNQEIGELIGGVKVITVLDQIDKVLVEEPHLDIGSLFIKVIGYFTSYIGVDVDKF